MSDFGFRSYDAGGDIIVDGASLLNRFRYSTEVATGVSSNTTLSDISGKSTVELVTMVNPPTTGLWWWSMAHTVTRSGTTISWAPASGLPLIVSSASLIEVFLYS